MTGCWKKTLLGTMLVGLISIEAFAADPLGPSSSLYGDPNLRHPLELNKASWIYQGKPEPRELAIHDLVTVLVDHKTQVISEGEMDRRKKADGLLKLTDWIGIDGLAIRPDPQSTGDPTVAGNMQNKYRAYADFDSIETMKFSISCEIVDIRPNGTLVLDGRSSIQNNNDNWEISLTGIVRAEDVMENNTVLSEKVFELRIGKRESGHVRDGYRRGWVQRWMDKYQLF